MVRKQTTPPAQNRKSATPNAGKGKYPITPAVIEQRRDAATKHGLYRARTALPAGERKKLRRYERQLWELVPWLASTDVATVQTFASLLILKDKLAANLAEHGLTTDEGEPRRLVGEYRQVLQLLLQYCSQLGLTPQARAQLKLTVGRGKQLDFAGAMGDEQDD